jgi:hypothetical protein
MSGSGSAGGSTPSAAGADTTDALRGMASAGHGDVAYQQAYRDCMQRKGF